MGIVDEAIEHGVGIGGISNEHMPLVHEELAGDDGGTVTVAIFKCHSACNIGSDASLVQRRLFCADQSGLKQVDFAATVHLTSNELEARDLTFGLAIGPW